MWGVLRATGIVAASIAVAAVLACVTLAAFLLMTPSLLCQPPKKVYTGTQWTLGPLRRAAEAYRQEQGEWPCDDDDSTFLYKLMGGKERPPYLVWKRVGGGICVTCQVYNMTSPRFSPWAQKPKGAVSNAPFYIPQTLIQ